MENLFCFLCGKQKATKLNWIELFEYTRDDDDDDAMVGTKNLSHSSSFSSDVVWFVCFYRKEKFKDEKSCWDGGEYERRKKW